MDGCLAIAAGLACGEMISATVAASFFPAEEDEERVGQVVSSGIILGCIQCRRDGCIVGFLERVWDKLGCCCMPSCACGGKDICGVQLIGGLWRGTESTSSE